MYLKAGSPPPQSPFAEFEGIVEQPGVLRNADHVDFGSAFGARARAKTPRNAHMSDRLRERLRGGGADMGNYNELCKLAAGDERAVFRS